MNTIDYKKLISYKLSQIAADVTWAFAPVYYDRLEDSRQRDQMNQAARSDKQNIAEGSSTASLSIKLNLYNSAKASAKELLEDFEDILRRESLPRWDKSDPRLARLRLLVEGYSPSSYSFSSSNSPNLASLLERIRRIRGLREIRGGVRGKDEDLETVVNYTIDVLTRNVALLDKQIRAIEEKHRTEGGYRESLLKKRLSFRRSFSLILLPLFFSLFLLGYIPPSVLAANSSIFTAELWVKPEIGVATRALVGKAEELRVFTDASGYVGCQIKATPPAGGWQTAAQATTTALPVNSWSHVACTYDKITIRVFVNGIQVATQAETDAVDDTANALKIGQDDSASTTYTNLQGTTDDFQFYNYARTQKQIVQDMNAGHPAVGSPVGSPVAYYKFDEGQGTVAQNSGNGGSTLNGTLTNIASPATSTSGWTNDGKFNKALNFDGSNDYVTAGTSTSFNLTSGYTLSVWTYITANRWQYFLSKGHVTSSATNSNYVLGSNPSAHYTFYSSGASFGDTGISVGLNAWHHLLVTYDGTNLRFYKDGVLGNSKTGSNPSTYSDPLIIGAASSDAGGVQESILGAIDEVKIYNYALSEDEVKLDYNQGKAIVMGSLGTTTDGKTASNAKSRAYCPPGNVEGSCAAGQNPSPLAEWNFDEGSGASATETSGNNYIGTWAGGFSHWVPGKSGQAGNIADSNSYVTVSTNKIPDLGGTQTFSFWLKPFDNTANRTILYRVGFCGNFGGGGWVIRRDSSSQLAFIFQDSNHITERYNYSTLSTPINAWTYVTIVRNGATLKAYANGILSDTDAIVTTTEDNGAGNVILGREQAGCGLPTGFYGLVDQVRIYNYARTPAQIAWDYNRGAPIVHYKFDECNGTTISDWAPGANPNSFNGNTATLTVGASGSQTSAGTCSSGVATEAWNNGATGKWNASAKLDGTDDYAQVTDTTNLRFDESTKDFSVFGWVKRTTTGTEYILSKEDADNDGYRLMFNSSNQVVCSEDATDVTSSTAITDTNWHLVGCTIDRDGNGQVYVDGKVDGASVAMGTDAMATTSNIRLGTRSYSSTNYFAGQIDDVRIYNYALSGEQVKLLYNGGAAVSFR